MRTPEGTAHKDRKMSILILIILIPVLQVFAIWLLTVRDKRLRDLDKRSYEARVAPLRVRPKFIEE